MDVRLPNGKIIRGVPEGTPKDVIMQKAIDSGLIEGPTAEALPQDNQSAPDEQPQTARERIADWKNKIVSGIRGGTDVAATLGTGAGATILGGLTGAYRAPFVGVDQAVKDMETVREGLTFQPRSDAGRQALESISRTIQPAAEKFAQGEDYLGDAAFEATGSPAVAAAYHSIPTAALELLGAGAAVKGARGLKGIKELPQTRGVKRAIFKAAPGGRQLKRSADSLFKKVDDMGVTVKDSATTRLMDDVFNAMEESGLDPQVTPGAYGIVERMYRDGGKPLRLSDIEKWREVAKGPASSVTNPKESMLGTIAVNKIDEFLEDLSPTQMLTGKANADKIGVTYRAAREQWGRYRRAEMLDKAVAVASDARSGWENGLRQEFTKILQNIERGKIKGFKPHEIESMRKVARGTAGANTFRELGKMGVGFGQLGNNWLGAFLTGSAAYSVGGGPVGAIALVGAGTGFKKLAEVLTRANASHANQLIRAGTDARKITEAYFKMVPKAKRSADELSLLLMRRNIDLSDFPRLEIEKQAADLALKRRAELAGIMAAGETKNQAE